MGRCPRGQWEWTVNPSALAYGGSNPSLPMLRLCGCSSIGRASPFQGGCCEFESHHPLDYAQIAQLVERILGKDEVHGFDPRFGLITANKRVILEFVNI